MANEEIKTVVDSLLSEKSMMLQLSTVAISFSDIEYIVKILFYIVSIISAIVLIAKTLKEIRLQNRKEKDYLKTHKDYDES